MFFVTSLMWSKVMTCKGVISFSCLASDILQNGCKVKVFGHNNSVKMQGLAPLDDLQSIRKTWEMKMVTN